MRPPLLYLAVGMKRTGKSYQTMRILRQMVAQLHRKVLIFDTQNEYSDKVQFPDIRTLAHNQIALFTLHPEVSIRRIPPFHISGSRSGEEFTPDEKAALVVHILSYYRKGAILLEDLNDYVYDYMPQDIVGKILSQRHKELDIILHYHSLGAVQKKIWRHINVIRLHKCEDSVLTNKDKFPDKYELFRLAELLVNEQFSAGNKFFFVEILTNENKITGEFGPEDRDKAIESYISLHYNSKIRPLLNQFARGGKRQFTEQTAFEAVYVELKTTYFGN
jgi:hypothetical protein